MLYSVVPPCESGRQQQRLGCIYIHIQMAAAEQQQAQNTRTTRKQFKNDRFLYVRRAKKQQHKSQNKNALSVHAVRCPHIHTPSSCRARSGPHYGVLCGLCGCSGSTLHTIPSPLKLIIKGAGRQARTARMYYLYSSNINDGDSAL